MKLYNRHMTFAAGIALALSLLLAAGPAGSEPTSQVSETIRYLIGQVAGSDMRFVRNDSEYTPDEAAGHMQKKYRHFRDDIDTPEDFIALCATKSLMSGKPYRVIDPLGNELGTSDWLRAELAAWQERGQ